jgi:anti-anti-sigma factor
VAHGEVSPEAATWDGHLLLVFFSEQDRAARLAAWTKRGLDRGDAVLYAGDDAGALDTLLRPFGLDLSPTMRSGQLQLVPAETLVIGEGPTVLAEQALASGYPGVRCLATAADVRRLLPTPSELDGFERTVDDLCASRPVGWLCELDRSTGPSERTRLLSSRHPGGIRESNVVTSVDEPGSVRLAGDIDIANADLVTSALAASPVPDADRLRLTVDLRDVTFVDVIGCRSIVEGTERLRTRGGLVTILARQRIHHVLELYGLGSMANFDLVLVT